MQMRRRSNRVSGSADITDRVACHDGIPLLESSPSIEMCVVVNLPPRPEHVYDEAAKPVRAYAHHDSLRSARYRSAAPREDVDSLVRASATTGCAPCIRDIALSHTVHGNVDARWRT